MITLEETEKFGATTAQPLAVEFIYVLKKYKNTYWIKISIIHDTYEILEILRARRDTLKMRNYHLSYLVNTPCLYVILLAQTNKKCK